MKLIESAKIEEYLRQPCHTRSLRLSRFEVRDFSYTCLWLSKYTRHHQIMSSKNVVTIGRLIQKCLKEAYFLPQKPSSYSKGYRFLNDKKYRMYDCPPSSLNVDRLLSPFRHLPAAGNEIPIIMECHPQAYLQQHWRQWLPAFPAVVIKSLDEALRDNVPVVTTAALQGIPEHKHSVPPDILCDEVFTE